MTDQNKIKSIFEDSFKNNTKVITEEIAKGVLSEYDISVPEFALVKDVDSAVTEARRLGFPLVAKIVSPQILHKTDVGGVKIGLEDEESVKAAFNDMYDRLSKDYDVKGGLTRENGPQRS